MGKNEKIVNAVIAVTVIILISVVVMAFYLAIIRLINNDSKKQGSMTIDESATEQTENIASNPLEGRYVELVGFDDMQLKCGDKVSLANPSSNGDFVLKYTLKNEENGKVLYETDLIPSGKCVAWTIGEDLKPGDYRIAFEQNPYWKNPDTGKYEPLTGGMNVVRIKVEE